MDRTERSDEQLNRLRQFRNRRDADLSLAFLAGQFKREIARPHKQMQTVVAAWQQLIPAELAQATRLESFQRGTLKIAVDTSAQLYELDRLLREGLQDELTRIHQGPAIRRIQLRVANTAMDGK